MTWGVCSSNISPNNSNLGSGMRGVVLLGLVFDLYIAVRPGYVVHHSDRDVSQSGISWRFLE